MPQELPTGEDFIYIFKSSYNGPAREELLLLIARKREWMQAKRELGSPKEAAKMRASVGQLARTTSEKLKLKTALERVDPVKCEEAALRAQHELALALGLDHLRMRIGIVAVPKQGGATEDVWDANVLSNELYRGVGERPRDHALLLVVSKHLFGPILPGPTCVVKNHERPIEAVLKVIKSIRTADQHARLVDIDADAYDAKIIANDSALRPLRDAAPRPFSLDLVASMREPIPTAVYLPEATNDVPLIGPSPDLLGMRIGTNVAWSATYSRTIEEHYGGVAIPRNLTVKVSDKVKIAAKPKAVEGRIVRISSDGSQTRAEPYAPTLVAVFYEQNHERIVEMALSNLRDIDSNPRIADFMEDRQDSRVLNGAHRSRQHLHNDRASGGVALTADRLDRDIVPAIRA